MKKSSIILLLLLISSLQGKPKPHILAQQFLACLQELESGIKLHALNDLG